MDQFGNPTAQGLGAPEEPATSGGASSTATGSEQKAPTSPEEALDALHATLMTNESDVSARQQGLQVLRTQVGSLQKSAGDISKVVEAFAAARPRLAGRAEDAARFLDCEQAVIEEKVPEETRVAVGRAHTAVGQRLSGWEQEVGKQQEALDTLGDQQREREQAVTEAQAAFDELQARQKRVDDSLKELEGLRGRLEKADKPEDGPRMVVLHTLATEVSDAVGTQLVTAEELRGSLDTAWLHLYDVQRQLRETVDGRTKAELRIEELTTKIKALRTDRVEATLKEYRRPPQDADGSDTPEDAAGGTREETTGASAAVPEQPES